jgi:hypothetical protein
MFATAGRFLKPPITHIVYIDTNLCRVSLARSKYETVLRLLIICVAKIFDLAVRLWVAGSIAEGLQLFRSWSFAKTLSKAKEC